MTHKWNYQPITPESEQSQNGSFYFNKIAPAQLSEKE